MSFSVAFEIRVDFSMMLNLCATTYNKVICLAHFTSEGTGLLVGILITGGMMSECLRGITRARGDTCRRQQQSPVLMRWSHRINVLYYLEYILQL